MPTFSVNAWREPDITCPYVVGALGGHEAMMVNLRERGVFHYDFGAMMRQRDEAIRGRGRSRSPRWVVRTP